MAWSSICSKPNHGIALLLTCTLVCFIGLSPFAFAQKYTPEHPVVLEMVRKGVGFLSSTGAGLSGEGINILTGYTIYKVDGNPDHPVVASAVAEARRLASTFASGGNSAEARSMYIPALAGMLLASVDIEAHGLQIRQIRDFLLRTQKPHGGFGYTVAGPYINSGDISQTQYVMLCLWTMSQLGIEVPDDAIARTITFLEAAQTNEGGWPYQFGGANAEGGSTTNSLAAAGFSALLIAGDCLGMYRSKIAENQEEEGIIPIAFKRILPETQRSRVNVDRTRLESATKRGEAWHLANPYRRAQWHYYYVYSRERYESFLEITKGKQQKSPEWYNQAVETLQAAQAANGSWGSAADGDTPLAPEACTCFAVLFLIRSTQKAIGALNEAYVVGGVDLPDDLTAVRAVGGKVMSKTSTTSIDDALKMLEQDGKTDTEELVADKMRLAPDPIQRKEQLNRFTRLLSAKDPKTRKIAAKLLGRGDDLDVVPALIYAVSTDPDPEVPRIAEQSLRLISRQLDTHHLPKDKSVKLSDQTKSKAGSEWKKWFSGLRPDYVFVD